MTDLITNIRLMIADEYPVVRQGLGLTFASVPDIEVVAEVDTPEAAVEAYRMHRPDVTLIDLCIRRGHTAAATHTIRTEFPEARFLVFTTYEGIDDVLLALKDRIQGYLLKSARPSEIVDAVRSVARGRRWLSPNLAVKLGHVAVDPTLTEREREVLAAVASGRSNQQVGSALFISEGTVKFHINNILTKLGASDRTEAVVIGLQRGLLRLSDG